MIHEGILALAKADSVLGPLLGTAKSPPVWQFYALTLPEAVELGTLVAATYQVIGGGSTPTLDTRGMQRMRVQYTFFAKMYRPAATARDAMQALLDGARGLLSDGTDLSQARFIQALDFFDDEARVYRAAVEVYLNFTL